MIPLILQADIFRSATKKKRSKSGGAKKAIGFLCIDEQFVITRRFFGAGGQVVISGIRNLFAFGVEQGLLLVSMTPNSTPSIFSGVLLKVLAGDVQGGHISGVSSFCNSLFCFLQMVLLDLRMLLVFLLHDGPIFEGQISAAAEILMEAKDKAVENFETVKWKLRTTQALYWI